MSEPIIPKERMTAWQRWELPSFNTGGRSDGLPGRGMPTAGELERMHAQAHDEGYQAGYAEGLRQAGEELERIAALAESLEREVLRVDQEIMQDLLQLSLDIAKQMVRQTVRKNPEVIIGVIRDALSSLPHLNQGAHLIVHPDDAALLHQHMGEHLAQSGWRILKDENMERGGFKVETAHSQIDATLSSRWERIAASLEQENRWEDVP